MQCDYASGPKPPILRYWSGPEVVDQLVSGRVENHRVYLDAATGLSEGVPGDVEDEHADRRGQLQPFDLGWSRCPGGQPFGEPRRSMPQLGQAGVDAAGPGGRGPGA